MKQNIKNASICKAILTKTKTKTKTRKLMTGRNFFHHQGYKERSTWS